MSGNCIEKGCRNLETRCKNCGRVVVSAFFDKDEDPLFLPNTNDGWISVKDNLPQVGQYVLVWDGNKGLNNNCFYEIASYRTFNNGAFFVSGPYLLHGIVYWMPLPKPPCE